MSTAADAGEYVIWDQGDPSKQLKVTSGGATTFTNPGSGVGFTAESSTTVRISGIMSTDVSALTTKANSIYVAFWSDDWGDTNCLRKDGVCSVNSDCTGQL